MNQEKKYEIHINVEAINEKNMNLMTETLRMRNFLINDLKKDEKNPNDYEFHTTKEHNFFGYRLRIVAKPKRGKAV